MSGWAVIVRGVAIGVCCFVLIPEQPRSVIATILLSIAFLATDWDHGA